MLELYKLPFGASSASAYLELCLVNAHKVLGRAARWKLAISVCCWAQIHIRHSGAMITAGAALLPSGIAEVLHLHACSWLMSTQGAMQLSRFGRQWQYACMCSFLHGTASQSCCLCRMGLHKPDSTAEKCLAGLWYHVYLIVARLRGRSAVAVFACDKVQAVKAPRRCSCHSVCGL